MYDCIPKNTGDFNTRHGDFGHQNVTIEAANLMHPAPTPTTNN